MPSKSARPDLQIPNVDLWTFLLGKEQGDEDKRESGSMSLLSNRVMENNALLQLSLSMSTTSGVMLHAKR